MMIVMRPRLIDCWSAVHNQTPQQPGVGQMSEAVIDCLMRYPWQSHRDNGEHGRRVRVRLCPNRVEHGNTLTRDPQSSGTDQPFKFLDSSLTHC